MIKILSLLLLLTSVQAKKFDIFFYQEEKVPLVIKSKKGDVSGIYYDALTRILEESGIDYKIKLTPNLRRRRAFATGEVFISCCSNPDWRNKASEKNVQIFSEPFMELEDVLVYRKDFQLNYSRISKNHFALIRGYSYKTEKSFNKITRLKNERNVLEFVNSNRANIGIVNKTIAQYYIKKLGLNLKIGPIYSSDYIHVRIHKKRKHLVKPINKSIKKLKNDGFFIGLKQKYISAMNKELSSFHELDFLALK